MIDDILNYETLIKLIIKENKFEDYKIYENKVKNSIIRKFISKLKIKIIINIKLKIFVRNLETNINVIIPVF